MASDCEVDEECQWIQCNEKEGKQKRPDDGSGTTKLTYRKAKLRKALVGDDDREGRVREDPGVNEPRSEALVRVLERLPRLFLGGLVRRQGTFHRERELAVDVGLRLVGLYDDGHLAVGGLGGRRRRQRIGLVRALGPPRHVVPVAEGVDVENVDVRGHDQQILREGREHVPRIEVHERGDEVQTESGRESDDDRAGRGREQGLGEGGGGGGVEVLRLRAREGPYDEIHRQHDDVELDEGKDDKGYEVGVPRSGVAKGPESVVACLRSRPARRKPIGCRHAAFVVAEAGEGRKDKRAYRMDLPLGPVTEREDELHDDKGEIEVLEHGVDDGRGLGAEREGRLTVVVGRRPDEIHDDRRRQPEGSCVAGSCRQSRGVAADGNPSG